MSEREYYENSPYVNFCKAEGYEDKFDRETDRFRNLSMITHASMVGGKESLSIEELWPTWRDNTEKEIFAMDDEAKQRILKIHNLNPDLK